MELIYIAIYLLGCVVAYGLAFGGAQGHFPSIAEQEKKKDRNYALVASLFSWVGFAGVVLGTWWSGFNPFKFFKLK